MISREELKEYAGSSGLSLYQQEKDYLLKLFLFNYYNSSEDAVFKGGTCIKYLFGLNRFSEDLDFTLKTNPKKFQKQVALTLKKIRKIGIENNFKKQELFRDAFTCEISFKGPLYNNEKHSLNKIRIDAGKRRGIKLKPKWELIESNYPETPKNFLVLALNEEEILAEKISALLSRNKGRDLYDVWFLLKKGVKLKPKLVDRKLLSRKLKFPSEKEYNRDLEKLTSKVIPYKQVIEEVKKRIKN